jgi:hypothetical protein
MRLSKRSSSAAGDGVVTPATIARAMTTRANPHRDRRAELSGGEEAIATLV